MRALTEAEATKVMEKLYKYIGKRVAVVVEGEASAGGGEQQRHCFRLNKNRVYYIRESLVRRAARVQRRKLMSLGTQIGKFTKTQNFRLTIHSLDLLARHAKNKVRGARAPAPPPRRRRRRRRPGSSQAMMNHLAQLSLQADAPREGRT